MRSAVRSDINITPLIDIVLVLLIVFITLVPSLMRAHTPRLPLVATDPSVPAPRHGPPVLALAADGGLRLDGQAVAAGDLEAALRVALAQRGAEDQKLVLRIDGDGRFQQSVDLLDRIHVLDPKLPVLVR